MYNQYPHCRIPLYKSAQLLSRLILYAELLQDLLSWTCSTSCRINIVNWFEQLIQFNFYRSEKPLGVRMGSSKDNTPFSPNQSWRLVDNVDFIEAQFSLGDFCLNHFPENLQFARSIQNANSVADLKTTLKPILHLLYTERNDLAEEFTLLLHRINQTTE